MYRQSFDRSVTTTAFSHHFDSLFEFRPDINEGCSLSLFYQTGYCIFASSTSKAVQLDTKILSGPTSEPS